MSNPLPNSSIVEGSGTVTAFKGVPIFARLTAGADIIFAPAEKLRLVGAFLFALDKKIARSDSEAESGCDRNAELTGVTFEMDIGSANVAMLQIPIAAAIAHTRTMR